MQFNVCGTCGACDGRAGLLINLGGNTVSECMNCYDTRKTGDITIHTNLRRTDEEIQRTFAILDKVGV